MTGIFNLKNNNFKYFDYEATYTEGWGYAEDRNTEADGCKILRTWAVPNGIHSDAGHTKYAEPNRKTK